MRNVRSIRVGEMSGVGEAQRVAAAGARELGFGETAMGRVAIVARELASNLVKHAGGGVIVVRLVEVPEVPCVEFLALDRGPGIRNVGESLRDGQSTAGSLGAGLGAVRRLSSVFDLYAPPGAGAAVLSRISARAPKLTLPLDPATIGAVCLSLDDELACGDAWAAHQSTERTLVMVADGLGHGPVAAAAAVEAVHTFRVHVELGPADLVTAIDAALRPTRGAAVAVAEVLSQPSVVNYAGLGNIAARIYEGGNVRHLATSDGTAGTGTRKTTRYTYPWPSDGVLFMHSDGLDSHWDLDGYPGLLNRHPSLVAGVLLRDHRRERDDVTVVVVARAWAKP